MSTPLSWPDFRWSPIIDNKARAADGKFCRLLSCFHRTPRKVWAWLGAAKRKIIEFVSSAGTLIAEFSDVQSGRDDSRVELLKAIQLAKQENAKIVLARLDRFSRRVSF